MKTTALTATEWRNFLLLADPERAVPGDIPSESLPRLLAAAETHGLAPIFARKLGLHADLRERLPQAGLLDRLTRGHEIATGFTMLLEHYYVGLQARMTSENLPAVIVKGPVFARALYRREGDRPFTDIDVLAHPDAIDRVAQLLTEAGFARNRKEFWDRSDTYQEQKWLLASNPNVMVELHGNLVHYPSLRRGVSFGFADYERARQQDGDCPFALFMTAVVHGSLGHKFHKLQLLVDVLQAFRRLPADGMDRLADVAQKLSLRLEAALCLELVAQLFGEERAAEWARRIGPPRQAAIARALVSPQSVLEVEGSKASRLRRHAFRWLQSLHLGRDA